jgi:hypothetical protein
MSVPQGNDVEIPGRRFPIGGEAAGKPPRCQEWPPYESRFETGFAETKRQRFRKQTEVEGDLLEAILFIHIGFFAGWPFNCLYRGMNFWMILMSVKVIVTVIAFARGGGQDARFQDDKLDFRG